MTSQEVALQVMQQAISVLAEWVGYKLPSECQLAEKEHDAVKEAKTKLSWHNQKPSHLRLLFDAVKFCDKKEPEDSNYCPVEAISDSDPSIPYPVKQEPDLTEYKQTIATELKIEPKDWENLSLLTLIIEKYGSCLSFVESDVALIDMARSTAAVASAIAHNPEADNICLIGGDLSGIQKFIYTISSDGALKSLRARSFYLELVAEEIVKQLLEKLDLPRTSVIYAGGGNLYLLAPATENTKTVVQEVQTTFNKWLLGKFQAKIFLALAVSDPFPAADVATANFADRWNNTIKEVNKQKSCKFSNQISDLLKPKLSYEQRCRVCHRDDTPNLKEVENDEGELIIQCPTCQKMSQLGSQLFKTKVVVRSRRQDLPGKLGKISFQFTHYYLFENPENLPELQEEETVFYINNWQTSNYRFKNSVSLLLGNYAREIIKEPGKTMRAGELAEKSEGIKRVGYLRMDVDNLGKIFAKGLGNKHSLPRLAGLSRQMSYFFKTYLNSLAKNRHRNFIESLKNPNCLTKESRSELVFIYAGGDDLFVSGAWNQVVEFAFDVYQAFRAYTGNNPDITLSGGVSINDVKFPLYQAASESGESEEAAKGNGRDSLGLFGEVFKWDEWLGNSEASGLITGVLQLVTHIESLRIETNAARSFVRNLLITAKIQSQMIEERQKKIKEIKKQQRIITEKESIIAKIEEEAQDIRRYLHLPKIAYTISRLPNQVREGSNFKPVRQALLSPQNADYFRAIATWIELLTRKDSYDSNND